MDLKVYGCKNTALKKDIISATHFYAKELLSPQMLPHVSLTIRFSETIEELGSCCVTFTNDWYKPREFDIVLKNKKSKRILLITLAHEMVHLRQFAKGELANGLTRWKGESVDSDHVEYSMLPWEIEAASLEYILYALYKEHIKEGRNE